MQQPFLVIGAVFGALGVGIGPFGAHALKSMLAASGRSATYETAVHYHLIHTVVLLIVGVWALQAGPALPWLTRAGWSFAAGTVIFSGSLYVLCLTGAKWLGAITPIGGLLLIAGWLCLAAAALRA
jgi:uncharacterized membrane protein YgdD (TMEM256/DUF423 family)